MTSVIPRPDYDVKARRISGTRAALLAAVLFVGVNAARDQDVAAQPAWRAGGFLDVGYPFTEKATVTGFVVNSYFHVSHPNDTPSVGGQLAYAASPPVSIKQTVLTGSHQSDTSLRSWRLLSDTILTFERSGK